MLSKMMCEKFIANDPLFMCITAPRKLQLIGNYKIDRLGKIPRMYPSRNWTPL